MPKNVNSGCYCESSFIFKQPVDIEYFVGVFEGEEDIPPVRQCEIAGRVEIIGHKIGQVGLLQAVFEFLLRGLADQTTVQL